MNKIRFMLVEALKCLAQLALLPIAPYGEDRIDAFRLYCDRLTVSDQLAERQKPGSLFNRLARAAHRQERQNAITLPSYYELQRRWRDTSYCYARFAKKLFFQLVVFYAVMELNAILLEYWPHGQHLFESTVVGFGQRLDVFWDWVYHLLAGPNAR
jgi:hypothetical protein